MRWFYQTFFQEVDVALNMPFDTVCVYPHVTVASFINWPFDVPSANPNDLLPRFYTDDESGFLAGRDRWQDADDFVFSLQLNSVTNGYMRVKRDNILRLLKSPFADLRTAGGLRQLQFNDAQNIATLSFNNQRNLIVDLSGRSGERVVIASTLTKPVAKRKISGPGSLAARSTSVTIEDTEIQLAFPSQ